MAVRYKQKCPRCRTNYVTVSWRNRNVVCFECQKNELEGEITDPDMKRLFDLPEEFYRENSFLRNIKISYLKWGKLSDKQADAFRKTVKKLKEERKKPAKEPEFDTDI